MKNLRLFGFLLTALLPAIANEHWIPSSDRVGDAPQTTEATCAKRTYTFTDNVLRENGTKQPSPRTVANPVWLAHENEIWLLGGDGARDGTEVQIYNPARRRWRFGPPLPSPPTAAASRDNELIVRCADATFQLAPAPELTPKPTRTSVLPRPVWDPTGIAGRSGPDRPFTCEPAFPNLKLQRPVHLVSIPASDPERLMAVELKNRILTFPNQPDVTVADDVTQSLNIPTDHHTYAVAFHPSFPSPPELFVMLNEGSTNVVRRYTIDNFDPAKPPVINPDSGQDVIRWWSKGHNGGDLAFGPDGMLYISSGDGQAPRDPLHIGQKTDDLLGSILRLDIRERPYVIPPDNPFVGIDGARDELFNYGHRNPWKMAFDRAGNLWVGDNGDEQWESIYRSTPGCNHGWSTFEGSHPYRPEEGLAGPTKTLSGPVAEHAHAVFRSVIGGRECRDPRLPQLDGTYIYGDYITGKIWGFRWTNHDAGGGTKTDHRPLADLRAQLLAFGETRDGTLLILHNDGRISRLAVPPEDEPAAKRKPFPRQLSQTGLITKTPDGPQWADGLIPYTIRHPMWRDGETTTRAFALPTPPSGKVRFRTDTPQRDMSWIIPRSADPNFGGVFALTIHRAKDVPVETQVMVSQSEVFYFYTYAWNERGTDATLVPPDGATIRGRRFASRSECATCHTAGSNFLLGFQTGQLNTSDQLARWTAMGFTDNPRMKRPARFESWAGRHADAPNQRAARARAYLHINCAHCHQEGGAGGRGDFLLHHAMAWTDCGLDQKPRLDLWNIPDARLLAPGNPDASMLLKRMSVRGPGQMPLFGSTKIDELGRKTLKDWIAHLTSP